MHSGQSGDIPGPLGVETPGEYPGKEALPGLLSCGTLLSPVFSEEDTSAYETGCSILCETVVCDKFPEVAISCEPKGFGVNPGGGSGIP